MIKTLTLLRKSDSVSQETFLEAWSRSLRGPVSPGILRLVQHEVEPPPPSPPGSPPLALQVDGMEEIWFASDADPVAHRRDLSAGVIAALTSVTFEEKVIADELPPGASGDGMVKRLVVLLRKQGWTHDEFIRHWVGVHAPLALKVVGGARKYSQLYPQRVLANPAGLPDLGVEIDGFSDSWFDDPAHLARSLDVPGGLELAKDNRVYVQTSKLIFYKEVELKAFKP